jgi:hypothetical protein
MSALIVSDLRTTVLSRWYVRLADNPSEKRNHFRTKLVYYRAAAELLEADPSRPLTWKRVVAAARPRGARSTFYEVAGTHARHRMFDALITNGDSDSIQLALSYLRNDPVDQLVDETKIWSYWPYRQRLLAILSGTTMAQAELEDVSARCLAAWAKQHGNLAAALDHAPPACAVEDLMVISQGRLAAVRAAGRLSDQLRKCTTVL